MRRVAILVANATFGTDSGITNLRFRIADVQALETLLRDPEIGRYDRIVSVIDKRADEILTELNALLDEERGASVLFYYSGHGKPSDAGKLYLAASNTTERLLAATGVSFASVLEMKDSYGFGRFATILDCCFAGLGSPDIKGAEDDRLKAFTEGRGIFFLGAANATEAAKEDSQLGHGVFTAGIIEGLESGLADVDGDGRISGPDLFAWSRDFAIKHGSHKPVQVNRVADDDLVLAFSRRRLNPEDIYRIRTKLLVCFENRMMSSSELERLRQYFLDPIFVLTPVPGSLEASFLDYARGKIVWDELSRRQGEFPDVSKANDQPSRYKHKAQRLRRRTALMVGMFVLTGCVIFVVVYRPSLIHFYTTLVNKENSPSAESSDGCAQFPSLCSLVDSTKDDRPQLKVPPPRPQDRGTLECFNGLGDCPAYPAAIPACLKGLGDCPDKQ